MKRLVAAAALVLGAVFLFPRASAADSRVVWYYGQQPSSQNLNLQPRYDRLAQGTLASTLLGTAGGYSNLVITPAGGLSVTVGPPAANTIGAVYQYLPDDSTPLGGGIFGPTTALAADPSQILVQGQVNSASTGIGPVAVPTSNSQITLIECQIISTNSNSQNATFINSVGAQSIVGVNRDRIDGVACQQKAGTASASPNIPLSDTGYAGVGYITVPSGTSAITSGMVTMLPSISPISKPSLLSCNTQAECTTALSYPLNVSGQLAISGTLTSSQLQGAALPTSLPGATLIVDGDSVPAGANSSVCPNSIARAPSSTDTCLVGLLAYKHRFAGVQDVAMGGTSLQPFAANPSTSTTLANAVNWTPGQSTVTLSLANGSVFANGAAILATNGTYGVYGTIASGGGTNSVVLNVNAGMPQNPGFSSTVTIPSGSWVGGSDLLDRYTQTLVPAINAVGAQNAYVLLWAWGNDERNDGCAGCGRGGLNLSSLNYQADLESVVSGLHTATGIAYSHILQSGGYWQDPSYVPAQSKSMEPAYVAATARVANEFGTLWADTYKATADDADGPNCYTPGGTGQHPTDACQAFIEQAFEAAGAQNLSSGTSGLASVSAAIGSATVSERDKFGVYNGAFVAVNCCGTGFFESRRHVSTSINGGYYLTTDNGNGTHTTDWNINTPATATPNLDFSGPNGAAFDLNPAGGLNLRGGAPFLAINRQNASSVNAGITLNTLGGSAIDWNIGTPTGGSPDFVLSSNAIGNALDLTQSGNLTIPGYLNALGSVNTNGYVNAYRSGTSVQNSGVFFTTGTALANSVDWHAYTPSGANPPLVFSNGSTGATLTLNQDLSIVGTQFKQGASSVPYAAGFTAASSHHEFQTASASLSSCASQATCLQTALVTFATPYTTAPNVCQITQTGSSPKPVTTSFIATTSGATIYFSNVGTASLTANVPVAVHCFSS